MQFVLSRAVVVLLFAPLFASQGLSPWSRTVYCVPYSTITPVLRRVLSVSRAIYYKIALLFVSYTASGLPFSYNNYTYFIRKITTKIVVTLLLHPSDTISGLRFSPIFDILDYLKSRSYGSMCDHFTKHLLR